MSVKVNQLTKVYGQQIAVDAISFEARPGEVLGFLGPNGAGKSTTMKMLTCFISPTSGNAAICGHDIETASIEARRLIGYLPENNPLYKDMYVREYLQFVAGIHKTPNAQSRIADMITMTGLERECHKRIGALSKGYRQRVGLAQAMLHDPQVLILDEPTSGLDPNQLAEIRTLIKQLGKEKTLIFSTHIMQEVQAVCDRVIIINKGKMVADDPIDQLQQRIKGESVVTVEFKEELKKELLAKISGVRKVESAGANRWKLHTLLETDIRADVFRFAEQHQLTLLEMHREDLSIEEVFRKLTA